MSLASATRSELTKQFSTALWWILMIVLAGYVAITAAGLAFVIAASSTGLIGGNAQSTPTADGAAPLLYSLAASVGYVFPLLIGTLLVTGEFRHKTLTPTFLAIPRRGMVLWGKIIAGALMGVLYAVAAVVATTAPSAAILAGFGLATELGSIDTWALLGRVVIAFVLWTLIGIGVGLVVRNQVAAIVIVLAFTQFIEPLLRIGGSFVAGISDAARFLPGAASDALVGSSLLTFGGGSSETLQWWAGGAVLLAYGAVLLVLGYLTSWRRDVA